MNGIFIKHILAGIVCFTLLIGAKAFATDDLYSVASAIDPASGAPSSSVSLNMTAASTLQIDSIYNIHMASGGEEVGRVVATGVKGLAAKSLSSTGAQLSTTVISLQNNRGSLEVTSSDGKIVSLLLYDNQERNYFKAELDSSGYGVFESEPLELYQCDYIPLDDSSFLQMPSDIEELTPSLTALKSLESKPGAAKTLYINNWGGTLTGTAWNANFNSGNPINYTPYSFDSDTSVFSTYERYLMWLAWQEAAEDYSSYDVNVTTKQSVYNATATTNRSQIIATDTNSFYPGAGGVAYVGSFGSAYTNTGFTWNSGSGSMGMTHSHEAGHQMGLSHDGTSTLGYYGGHGNWGPIMGAPFNQAYVQWSKGEYVDANNTENDLTIIAGVLGVSNDDAGDSSSTPTPLYLPVVNYEGQIRARGITASQDLDWYSFSLTSESNVELEVISLFGDENETRAANLFINSVLEDSSGTQKAYEIADQNSDPTTNKLSYTGVLAPGTYRIGIAGHMSPYDWSVGNGSQYGVEGVYRINIDAEPIATADPEITSPVDGSTLMGSSQVFSWDTHGTANISNFLLKVGTLGVNSGDIYNQSFSGSATSRQVNNLPTDGSTLYVQLRWKINGNWSTANYTYTASTAAQPEMASPVPGSVLTGSSETFEWMDNGVQNISNFLLKVGTTGVNSGDIFNQNFSGTKTSVKVNGLPTDGSIIYVQLRYKISGTWYTLNYTYVAVSPERPEITYPAPYSSLLGSNVTFEWDNNYTQNITNFYLKVGTSGLGSNDIYDQNFSGSKRSIKVIGIPTDGSIIYVRLLWKKGGSWSREDYTYTASFPGMEPEIVSPVPSMSLSGTSETFRWSPNAQAGITNYVLKVGTNGAGSGNIFSQSFSSAITSRKVNNIPTGGSTLYVRLRWKVSGIWTAKDYTYTTAVIDGGGFNEEFNGDISNWEQESGVWNNADNKHLITQGVDGQWSRAMYSQSAYTDINYSAKIKRLGGATTSNNIVIRSSGFDSSGRCDTCYVFQYVDSGSFSVWRLDPGSETALQSWTSSTAIETGGIYNKLQVITQGPNMQFLINNVLVWSGSDASYSSGKVGVSAYHNNADGLNDMYVNWARLQQVAPGEFEATASQLSVEQQELNEAAKLNPMGLDSRKSDASMQGELMNGSGSDGGL